MGWSKLPSPGKVARGIEIGPCENDNCGHTDCELTRKMADTRCYICDEKIGYENAFYKTKKGLVHADCL